MGVGLLIGLFVLIVLIAVGAFSLWYFTSKKKSKVGIVVSSSLLLLLLAIVFTNKIDQLTHTKNDVRKDLEIAKIDLHDDFDILDNYVYGMPERFQETRLEISNSDLKRLIEEVKSDPNYHQAEEDYLLRDEMYSNPMKNTIVTASYYYRDHFVRESYYKEDNYVPSLFIVRLKENDSVIEYERIED